MRNFKSTTADAPSLREQINDHVRNESGRHRLFRATFNEQDAARLSKHAPTLWASWNAEGGDWSRVQAAANIDVERLYNAKATAKGSLSADGQEVLDTLLELRHVIANNVQVERDVEAVTREERIASNAHGPRHAASAGETWRDQEGKPVPVYRPQDALASGVRYDGPNLGEIVNAMVTGRGMQQIQNALSTGSVAAGGALVPEQLSAQIIDRLRARSTVIRAGARTVPMSTKTLAIAKITGDPTLSWAAEAASIGDTGPTFGAVTMTAKTLRAWVKFSRELLEDALNLDSTLRTVFANAMAVELDRAALVGSGTGQEPLGIGAAASAAPIVSMGANGAALTNWDKVIDVLQTLQDANAGDPTAMIMAPRTATTIAKLKDTTNQPLAIPPALASIPRYATTSVPVNQTQGSAVNASSIIAGDFADLILGVRSELQIVRSDSAFMQTNEIGLLFVMRADVAWTRAESFAQLRGIIP